MMKTTTKKLTAAQQKVMDIAKAQGSVSHTKGVSIHTITSLKKLGLLVWVDYNLWKPVS